MRRHKKLETVPLFETHGNEAFGSLIVDWNDFDMIHSFPCPGQILVAIFLSSSRAYLTKLLLRKNVRRAWRAMKG